jgi:hypothetical protein
MGANWRVVSFFNGALCQINSNLKKFLQENIDVVLPDVE